MARVDIAGHDVDDVSSLPAVSVVVPVYNGAHTVGDCIESLRALDYPRERLEIIVVDNGSADGTAAVLDAHRDRIVAITERTRGRSSARNAGMRRASGDVVAFTDADCVVDPRWLRHLVQPLGDLRVGVAAGTIRARTPVNFVSAFCERIHDHRLAVTVFRPAYAATVNWASRRAVLEQVGGFDAAFRRCEDVDLAYRLQQAGYSLVFVPEAIIYHRNAATLRALFSQGFLHGLYGVQALKTHHSFVTAFGHRRFDRRSYLAILSSTGRALCGRDRAAACEVVFNLGKKLGKVAGSVRFAYVDL